MDLGRSSNVRCCNRQQPTFQKRGRARMRSLTDSPTSMETSSAFRSTQCFFTDTIFKGRFLLDVVNRWMSFPVWLWERIVCRPFGETPPINPTYLHLQRTLWIAQAAGEKGFVQLRFCHHKPCLVLRQLNPGPFIFSRTALGLPFALPWVKISRHGLCDLILPGLLDVISLFREPRKKEKDSEI